MAERGKTDQIAVYIDFDNVVISRYDEVHGERAFHNDVRTGGADAAQVAERLKAAHLDIDAVLEYAASFGTIAISRAYADWSAPVNAAYKTDLVRASIDLVQMFPLSGTKNGADIRLAIDVIDDLARYDYVNHVLIFAGDSDYVSLAQRCKRLGRTVIGVGVARSVGKYWRSACDVFRMYEALPGVAAVAPVAAATPPAKVTAKKAAVEKTAPKKAAPKKATRGKVPATGEPASVKLLRRAMSLQSEKSTDGWVTAAGLKNQMMRLDASFDERSEGHKSFAAFLAAHPDVVETRSVNQVLSARLKA
ncbi:MAG TPA: NYN domain-containing protein [Mycobacteriales bacterium]|nr:NYN domain-containing protein [Mycobacteriales bacterium]